VLVVDDDDAARGTLAVGLERRGLRAVGAAGGAEALRHLYDSRPDAVLLDVYMPGMSGWATLERIRAISEIPVLMLTGESAELEKVRALKSGADDYVTKPYGLAELVARIEAVLRRACADTAPRERYDDGALQLDFSSGQAHAHGRLLSLTPLEFRLLGVFVAHPDQVLSAGQLLVGAWGHDYLAQDRVRVYVSYLRAKFRSAGVEPLIATVRGFGYRYSRPAA
jgi:DNA-binding response OmpR family regulator